MECHRACRRRQFQCQMADHSNLWCIRIYVLPLWTWPWWDSNMDGRGICSALLTHFPRIMLLMEKFSHSVRAHICRCGAKWEGWLDNQSYWKSKQSWWYSSFASWSFWRCMQTAMEWLGLQYKPIRLGVHLQYCFAKQNDSWWSSRTGTCCLFWHGVQLSTVS